MPFYLFAAAAAVVLGAGCAHSDLSSNVRDTRAWWNLSQCNATHDRAAWCEVRDRARSGQRLAL